MFSPPSRRRPSARTRAGLRAHSRRLTGADDDGNGGDGGSGAEEGGYLSPESQESTDEDDSASDASSCSSDKPPRWVASARPSEETEQIVRQEKYRLFGVPAPEERVVHIIDRQ
ncbi:hypothetical protein JCM10213_005471 [Rhodosporidiobolus nylandii]